MPRLIIVFAIGFVLGIAYERHDRYKKLMKGLDKLAAAVRREKRENWRTLVETGRI